MTNDEKSLVIAWKEIQHLAKYVIYKTRDKPTEERLKALEIAYRILGHEMNTKEVDN
jgi:hypothetical protein